MKVLAILIKLTWFSFSRNQDRGIVPYRGQQYSGSEAAECLFGNNFNFIIVLESCLYIRKKYGYKRKETLIKVVEYIFKYKMYTYLPMLSQRHLSLKQ